MPKRDIMREERLEETICESLQASGWIYEPGMKDTGWDERLGLFPADVLHWLSTQYPEDYAKAVPQDAPEATRENAQRLLLEYVAKRLESATRKDAQTGRIRGGLLGTLREGFKYAQTNARSATFGPMVAFPPANPLSVSAAKRAQDNRLRIIRQVHFDTTSGETLDLVATVNGIPVATFELKTDNTQSVKKAIKQYREDRVPSKNRRVLLPGRALVHFAVSNDEVYMTTALKGSDTRFLPFNQGHDGAGGNPPIAGKSATSYLWEKVLRPRLLLRILSDFAVWEPDSKSKRGTQGKLIFPRFHQLRAVEKVTTDVAERGAGGRYLIEHSAGSGKTKTIAWLAHRLIRQVAEDGTKTFDSVIVVTDRTALDTNIRQDMQALAASRGLVVSVGENSGAKSPQLQQALVEGGHIITCTLQTFPYVLSLLDNDPDIQGRNWCVIADEAHSSQTGSSASALRELLAEVELDESEDYTADDLLELRQEAVATASNMTFVALTATPKGKTLRLFGSQTSDGHYIAFDTYPMGQAIAEGFIMDVLTNYSTYTMWAEVRDELGRTEEVDQSAAVTNMVRFVRLHPTSIAQKVEVVVEHYRRNVAHHLDGQARAMVVTSSRKAAVHWAREMNRYINEKGYEFHSLVAFSDKVRMEDEPEPVTEVSMNGESDVERTFKDDDLDYRVLIVANKFQTGFNEPRLCAMYVDKHLSGVATVQTLSRLNRIHPNKPAPMVVDFINDPELIEADFKRYYQGAVIDTDIDPNSLHTLADELDTAGYYDPDEMNKVAEAYMAGEDSENLRGAANSILARWRTDRNSADKDTRERAKDFRAHVLKYRHAYEFLSQIIAYADADVSRRAMLCSVLEPNLHITELDNDEDFLTGVTLAGVAIAQSSVEENYSVSDGELEPLNVPEFTVRLGEPKTPLRAAFDEAVEKVNDIFSMAGVDVNSDETAQMIVAAWGTLSAQPEAVRLGKENSSEQLKRSRKFQQEATKAIFDGIEQRKQRDALLTTDRDVLKNVVATLAEIMAAANETGELE
ncbi:type I restriction endonuclease subunit R [Corynebacterium striatum]|uniref:type I restriction endonuclease subunit R n=1 Tax=Corynebacterium striatum TaxID=43770 RepID=UPI001419201E|nr:type I restriction endonuclease [Corynebacterium striatum]NHY11999.1 type I restriction endonuclease subunit R [Corynebacterium striatum]NHY36645.1 type I restriction endonuclease subunit R [Corynebacterium striatum]HAT1132916.1 type I restriction endonuclease subunit R [Corynebacterium striatum]HAT1140658.1 type I restriction endonuclease subunit R [Corynebacterium striatum]HAT1143189.1 type I restriction endonuclease subunit R [Corynebacterium striatum]